VVKKKGFTLVEILVVLVVIGILVALALSSFGVTKERAMDKEAKANLRLVQAAEKIYKLEMAHYFPPGTSTSDVSLINSNLKLRLPAPPKTISWNYNVDASSQQIKATRNKTGGRYFSINFTTDTITCTPNSDTCP